MSDIIVREDLKLAKLDDFNSVGDILATAEVLIKSKLIPSNFKNPEEVVTVVMKGREIGLGAITSLENIYYIQGRATVSINVMIALANAAGLGFKTIRDFEPLEDWFLNGEVVYENTEGAVRKKYDYVTTIRVYRKHEKLDGLIIENDVDFYFSEAKALGLITKDNWVKQKRNMLWVDGPCN